MLKRTAGILVLCLCAGWTAASGPATQTDPGNGRLAIEPQVVPAEGTFRALRVLSSSMAWASGSRGSIVRTVDGGRSWTAFRVPGAEKMDFRSLAAFDADRALVANAGSPGFIFKTSDGGRSWKTVYKGDHASFFIDAMAFWDDRRGLVLGDPIDGAFLFLETADGGDTWTPLPKESLPSPLAGEAFFAASNGSMVLLEKSLVWIASGGGGSSRLFVSADSGRTFHIAAVPVAAGRPTRGVFGLAFRSPREGLAVGGDYRELDYNDGVAASTSDGGRSWQVLRGGAVRGFRESVAYLPGRPDVLAVGPGGADYSADGGMNWRPFPLQDCHVAAFAPDGKCGWAAGNKGKIVRLRVIE